MSGGVATIAEVIGYTKDSSTPLTVFKPPAFGVGQLLVMVIAHDSANDLANLTAPGDWTQRANPFSGAGDAGKVWTHFYTGSEPSTWDFGFGSGAACAALLIRVTGAESTPTVAVTSRYFNSNGASEDSPTVTPSGNDDLLISVIASAGSNAPFSATEPAGMTNQGQAQLLNLYQAVAAASQSLTTADPTGVRTWTLISPTARQGGAFSIAVKSSGQFDPDPPLRPPAPELPPWLLDELILDAQRPLVGHQGSPLIKEKLTGGASGVNIVLTTAATTDVTDVLVLFHGNNFYTAAQLLAPTPGTWTQQALGDNGTNTVHEKIWTAKVTAPGAQTITITPAIDEEHTATLFVVTGVDPADFVDGTPAGGNGASNTTHTAPAVTPTTTNALLLYGAQAGTESNYSIPAGAINNGAVLEAEVDVPSFCTGAVASQQLATGGTTGTRILTCSASATFATATIAIKAGIPSAGGTPAPSFPFTGLTQPRRLRALPFRRGYAAAPVPAQVVVVPPTYITQTPRSRVKLFWPRRGKAVAPQPQPDTPPAVVQATRPTPSRPSRGHATPVPPAQAPVPPAYVPQTLRARVKTLTGRRPSADAPPQDQQPPAPRPPRIPIRPWRLGRGRQAQPVPPQIVPTPPAYAPQAVHARTKVLRLFRGRAAQPVPEQVAVQPPDYPPQSLRTRLRGLRLTRGRQAAPVPPQAVVPPPTYVPQTTRSRIRGLRLWRPRQAAPVAPQAIVTAPAKPRPVPARMATARRGRIATPPIAQQPAPLFERIRTRATQILRGKTRQVVPPQIIVTPPPYPPPPGQAKKRFWALRRRRAGTDGWMVQNCETPRPGTGITPRPGSGTTAYDTAITTRPTTGTTTRPDTGITEDPC